MRSDIVTWLAGLGSWAWHTAVSRFIVVNALAVGAFLTTRNRALVDRWTPRWLAVNLGLLGFGLGTPLLAWAVRLAVSALPELGRAAVTGPK